MLKILYIMRIRTDSECMLISTPTVGNAGAQHEWFEPLLT